jgi:hypothetical protein
LAGCVWRGLARFPVPARDRSLETLGLFDVEGLLADWAFFDDFVAGFFEPFFVAEVFFATFALFAGFLAFTRFFGAEALATLARRGLRAFFAVRFLTVFFLAIATTISFAR